ncbi:MAG: bifunctional nuclease family protein [Planctomycetota bacterium]|nr:bifunctional nuclease family protein [Planctomycetota bacterium]
MLIEFELYQIVITEGSQTQVIVVREKGGKRLFPIYIGHNEAMAIDRKLNDRQVPRPLTHDLLYSVIEQMGGKLMRVIINDMQEDYYLGLLEIRRGDETIVVDSRPSDAIALAVRAGCPIYVEEQVLNALQSRGS